MQTICRAGFDTFSASDTFRGYTDFFGRKLYGACLLTCHAGNAGIFFPMDLYQTEPIKPTIDCTQRAKILTKRAVEPYGQKKQKE